MIIKTDTELVIKSYEYWEKKELIPLLACEEMGELIKAISKAERHSTKFTDGYMFTYSDVEAVKEEIRDVAICLNHLMMRYDIDDCDINEMINEKLSQNK